MGRSKQAPVLTQKGAQMPLKVPKTLRLKIPKAIFSMPFTVCWVDKDNPKC